MPSRAAIASSPTAIACSSAEARLLPSLKLTTSSPAGKLVSMSETSTKPPIYLLDTMSFIFRAYHAMQRQRPMSTRTGIPTAATYVFVNMINKLRQGFPARISSPRSSTSAARCFAMRARKTSSRCASATQDAGALRKSTTKATRRTARRCRADLAQQLPYIRRALEAFRIPIL